VVLLFSPESSPVTSTGVVAVGCERKEDDGQDPAVSASEREKAGLFLGWPSSGMSRPDLFFSFSENTYKTKTCKIYNKIVKHAKMVKIIL
jgi:hypothetical protein